MRTRPNPAHQDAVARRLELLRAEIARDTGDVEPQEEPDPTPVTAAGEAPLVPVPGRHASRRSLLAALVPEAVRGRVSVGPWQLVVVASLVAVALGVACWWTVRGQASVAPASAAPELALASAPGLIPVSASSASPVAATGASSAASPGATGTVTVDVEGRVRRPGIRVLPQGSRVVDALRAAGGARGRRFLDGINLAAVLTDGQQIVVGGATPPATTLAAGASGSAGAVPGALVDLNTATADQLDTLPDVGPVTAQSIITWREQNGGFTSVQDLLEVDGIGEVTLEKLMPYVTV